MIHILSSLPENAVKNADDQKEKTLSSCLKPLLKSEATHKAIDMKMFFFYFYANKTHFHKRGFALSLVLKVRIFETLNSLQFFSSDRLVFPSFDKRARSHSVHIFKRNKMLHYLSDGRFPRGWEKSTITLRLTLLSFYPINKIIISCTSKNTLLIPNEILKYCISNIRNFINYIFQNRQEKMQDSQKAAK